MTNTQAGGAQDGETVSPPHTVFADILCAVDGTRRSYVAVEQAGALAGPTGQLTLLAVTAVTGSGTHKFAAIGSARAKRVLERATRIAENAGVSSTEVVDPGSPPSTVILQAAAEHDLVALGTPAMSWLGGVLVAAVGRATGLHGALVGPVGSETLQSFTTPLLMARPTPKGLPFADRILVASDALDGSDNVVELAGRLAREREASVILLHADGDDSGADSGARPSRIQAQAQALESALPGRSEMIVEQSGARDAIVEAAGSQGASLIVMGSRRRGGLRALGSVSRRVVRDAHCSVLLVPPEDLAG
ncbi:MAG: universal stress protein [Solirubrobacterales bacterium]